jgi:two-component system, sporulation sensor kinase E
VEEEEDLKASEGEEGLKWGSLAETNKAALYRDVIIIVGSLVAITLLHYYTDVRARELHDVYRRLYYLPIIYAAFRFGLRGGLLTGLAASLLFAPHAQLSLGGVLGDYGLDNGLEVILYNVVGVSTGILATSASRELTRSRAVSEELERAYAHLEQRALELTHVREHVQAIVNSIPSAVITLDSEGHIRTANPAGGRLLGDQPERLEGQPLESVFRELGGLSAKIEPVLDGRQELAGGEVEVVTRDGRRIPLATRVSRLVEADGSILGAVVTMEDQTELKTLTDELIRADRLAALGELVAGVAHEIRNPLAIIKGSLQVYAQTVPPSDDVHELSKIINQEIDRLDKVIKALLDFGRPSPSKTRECDLASVLDETITLTGKYAKQLGIDVIADKTGPLPLVTADPDQIKQVLVNLISNAVQAMPDGGVVHLGAHVGDGCVALTVRDEGVGIEPAQLAHIFDPFRTTRDGGTGLGLTIVHRIVEAHHGHIRVESEPGKGTTFTISLPRVGSEGTCDD